MAVHLKGERADEASALERAAELLNRARSPVIGGLVSTPPIKCRVENSYDRYYGIDPAGFTATLPPAQIGFKRCHV
jgi:hypothetical protein